MDEFYNNFKLMVAYPRTRSLNESETKYQNECYYKCNEEGCDFTQCQEEITKIKYPNEDTKKFVNNFVNSISKEKPNDRTYNYLADKMEGYQIIYRPETDMKAYNVVHFRREGSDGTTRTGIVELNERRFKLLNEGMK